MQIFGPPGRPAYDPGMNNRPHPIRNFLAGALLAFSGVLVLSSALAGEQPAPGQAAPAFELQDQNNRWHKLEDYRGRWLVMFFYPKADTPGCTTEACAFRDDIFKFKKLGVAVVGVSLDDVASQKEFADKYHLPYPLLSDARQETARAYGVLRNLGLTQYAKRQTFIIGPSGEVARHYPEVKPESHSAEILADLEELLAER